MSTIFYAIIPYDMTKQNMRVESIAKILTNNSDGNVLNLTLSEHLKYSRKIVSARDTGDVDGGNLILRTTKGFQNMRYIYQPIMFFGRMGD